MKTNIWFNLIVVGASCIAGCRQTEANSGDKEGAADETTESSSSGRDSFVEGTDQKVFDQAAPIGTEPFANTLGMRFVPVHGARVHFSIYETRRADYAAYAKAVPEVSDEWIKPPGGMNGRVTQDMPVVNVSWLDAVAFCRWLTEKERREGLLTEREEYRLPTSLEWSLAVGLLLPSHEGSKASIKPPDAHMFPWGEAWPPPKGSGNFCDESNSDILPSADGTMAPVIKGYSDGYKALAPVGTYSSNSFGLFDMAGNVSEWCEDEAGRPNQVIYRRIRGSAYIDGVRITLLSSFQDASEQDGGGTVVGFRCVLGKRRSPGKGRSDN